MTHTLSFKRRVCLVSLEMTNRKKTEGKKEKKVKQHKRRRKEKRTHAMPIFMIFLPQNILHE
jgi:hypothetical protein